MRKAAAIGLWEMPSESRPPHLNTREMFNIARLAVMWIEERIGAKDVTLEEYDLIRAYVDGREEHKEKQRKIDKIEGAGGKIFGDLPEGIMDQSSRVVSMDDWFVE